MTHLLRLLLGASVLLLIAVGVLTIMLIRQALATWGAPALMVLVAIVAVLTLIAYLIGVLAVTDE